MNTWLVVAFRHLPRSSRLRLLLLPETAGGKSGACALLDTGRWFITGFYGGYHTDVAAVLLHFTAFSGRERRFYDQPMVIQLSYYGATNIYCLSLLKTMLRRLCISIHVAPLRFFLAYLPRG